MAVVINFCHFWGRIVELNLSNQALKHSSMIPLENDTIIYHLSKILQKN